MLVGGERSLLSDRRQLVLRALIEEYISYAMPVGSRTLVERYNLGCSSATIRNELSRLEDEGYLAQPHTSAGRVPTDYGYRAFVDELLSRNEVDPDDALRQEILASAEDLDQLLDRTSQALARFTDCMTLVVPPRLLSVEIRQVNLVKLTDTRLLAVVVAADGQVFNRQMDLDAAYSDDDIARTQDLLNRVLAGKQFSSGADARSFSVDEVHDDLFRLVLAQIMLCLREQKVHKPQPLGMSHLLEKPEFSDSSVLLPVLRALEGDTMLLQVFDDAIHSTDPVVRIGHENASEALSNVSLIANRYGDGDQSGLIVIVGPTRMNYSNAIKAIRAAQDILQIR